MRVDTPEEVAALMRGHVGPRPGQRHLDREPGARRGRDAARRDRRRHRAAVADCDERGITGKDITPFLLGRIVELSDGRCLETNIALVRHNAVVGTAIAVAYAALT